MFYLSPTDYDFEEALLIMNQLKTAYSDYENINRNDRDQCRVLFHEFCMHFRNELKLEIESALYRSKNSLNVMGPVGGMYYIDPNATFEVKFWMPTIFEIILCKTWVGHVHLFSNKCGIDNLKKIMSFSI